MISGRESKVEGVATGEYQAVAGGRATSTITNTLQSTTGLTVSPMSTNIWKCIESTGGNYTAFQRQTDSQALTYFTSWYFITITPAQNVFSINFRERFSDLFSTASKLNRKDDNKSLSV